MPISKQLLYLFFLIPGLSASSEDELARAVGRGDLAAVRSMLNKGGDANGANCDGLTPLMIASGNGNIGIVSLLVGKGADVNRRSRRDGGLTALMFASHAGSLDAVKLLVTRGADVKAKTGNAGETDSNALDFALRKGHQEVAQALRSAGAELVNRTAVSQLLSVGSASSELDRLLKQPGARCLDEDLLSAAFSGDGLRVKELLSKGASPYCKGEMGSALHRAAFGDSSEAIRALAGAGANLNEKNGGGNTPLMIAVIFRKVQSVSTLVSLGASTEGAVPLAEKKGNAQIIDVLRKTSTR